MDFNYAGPWNGTPRSVLPPVIALSTPPATILMVEDEALVRVLGAAMLIDAGFRVVEAGDSDEALEFLESDCDVQLLFTDVSLPGAIDGLALAQRVRERWPRIGIIVVSGKSLSRPAELPTGSRFYRKPYDEAALVRHARELTAP
jgi:two-component system, response regulator PdtaR